MSDARKNLNDLEQTLRTLLNLGAKDLFEAVEQVNHQHERIKGLLDEVKTTLETYVGNFKGGAKVDDLLQRIDYYLRWLSPKEK